jgi:hypothetical protein
MEQTLVRRHHKTIFETIFIKKQVNKIIFLNRVIPPDLYHFSITFRRQRKK